MTHRPAGELKLRLSWVI